MDKFLYKKNLIFLEENVATRETLLLPIAFIGCRLQQHEADEPSILTDDLLNAAKRIDEMEGRSLRESTAD